MSTKNQKITNQSNANVSDAKVENKKELSKNLLDSLNALSLSEKTVSHKGLKSIFKADYNDKQLRTKYRNMLCKIQKIESENKVLEVQKGLIPEFLLHLKKGNIDKAKEIFSEISEICKKVYLAEDSFKNPKDYFSGNRSTETQKMLNVFMECANEFKA